MTNYIHEPKGTAVPPEDEAGSTEGGSETGGALADDGPGRTPAACNCAWTVDEMTLINEASGTDPDTEEMVEPDVSPEADTVTESSDGGGSSDMMRGGMPGDTDKR